MPWPNRSTASTSGNSSITTAPGRVSATSSSPPWNTSTHFNHRRLHGTITPGPGYTTPAAHENAYYDQTPTATEAATQ